MIEDVLCGLGEGEKLQILVPYHAFGGQELEIDRPIPEGPAHQHHRQRRNLVGLQQHQCLEQLVEGAKPAGKGHERAGAMQEMQLAHREVVEPEAQAGGEVGVRELLLRQRDVQPGRLATALPCPPVGGLHQSWATPGQNGDPLAMAINGAFGHQPAEGVGDLVVMALRDDPGGRCERPFTGGIARRALQRLGAGCHVPMRRVRVRDPGAAEDDDRVADPMLGQPGLGLEVVELQARPARHLAGDEVGILLGDPVARTVAGGTDPRVGGAIVVSRRGLRALGHAPNLADLLALRKRPLWPARNEWGRRLGPVRAIMPATPLRRTDRTGGIRCRFPFTAPPGTSPDRAT
jgi:hypothetical protein